MEEGTGGVDTFEVSGGIFSIIFLIVDGDGISMFDEYFEVFIELLCGYSGHEDIMIFELVSIADGEVTYLWDVIDMWVLLIEGVVWGLV